MALLIAPAQIKGSMSRALHPHSTKSQTISISLLRSRHAKIEQLNWDIFGNGAAKYEEDCTLYFHISNSTRKKKKSCETVFLLLRFKASRPPQNCQITKNSCWNGSW
ncbi:unnamed protein product [Ixodes pacificus]